MRRFEAVHGDNMPMKTKYLDPVLRSQHGSLLNHHVI